MFGTFFSSRARGSWIPEMDVYESEKSYRIIADLPEVKKDEIRVFSESKETLCFSGNRESLVQISSEWASVVRERSSGRFERCIDFTESFDPNGIKATFKNQTLELMIPKETKKRPTPQASDIKID